MVTEILIFLINKKKNIVVMVPYAPKGMERYIAISYFLGKLAKQCKKQNDNLNLMGPRK